MNTAAQKPAIGFIGLGAMGFPMAHLLDKAGYSLLVRDISSEVQSRFTQTHPSSRGVKSMADFSAADAIITMLPDSNVVEATVMGEQSHDGLIGVMRERSVLIDMSSSDPRRSKSLGEQVTAAGIDYLDAPVSGGTKRAVSGTLTIMVGGSKEVLESQREMLACLGSSIVHVGSFGAGHAVKSLNNFVSAAGLIAVTEALHVARRLGLDQEIVNEVFNNSSAKNSATDTKVKPFMLTGAFNSGFALKLMAKDVRTAIGLGESLGQSMAIGQAVKAVCDDALGALDDQADQTEIYRFIGNAGRPSAE